jgi:hypothetical protein
MIVVSLLLLAVLPATAQAPLTRISGEVVVVDGSNLELKPASGAPLALKLADPMRISVRSPLDAGAIHEGTYLGTTATPQPDGTLLASEVHVFAESMRGTGEGHRPMAEPGNTMTNATVASLSKSGAQSAKVAAVAPAATPGSLRMTLRYPGGEKVVVVPDDVPIVLTETGDRALLVRGAHVVAYVAKQPDGSLLAERMSVGKNGYVPLQ